MRLVNELKEIGKCISNIEQVKEKLKMEQGKMA